LPVTEYLADRVLALPTGLQLDHASVLRIADIVRAAVASAPSVRHHLGQRRAA